MISALMLYSFCYGMERPMEPMQHQEPMAKDQEHPQAGRVAALKAIFEGRKQPEPQNNAITSPRTQEQRIVGTEARQPTPEAPKETLAAEQAATEKLNPEQAAAEKLAEEPPALPPRVNKPKRSAVATKQERPLPPPPEEQTEAVSVPKLPVYAPGVTNLTEAKKAYLSGEHRRRKNKPEAAAEAKSEQPVTPEPSAEPLYIRPSVQIKKPEPVTGATDEEWAASGN